jgi:hypothetical protein
MRQREGDTMLHWKPALSVGVMMALVSLSAFGGGWSWLCRFAF